MKLYYKQYETPFVSDSLFTVLVVENAKDFYSLQYDLHLQVSGDRSTFSLSNHKGLLNIEKELDWIKSPWDLELNGRKIIVNLYTHLATMFQENGMEFLLLQKWTELQDLLFDAFVDESSVVMNNEVVGLQPLLKAFEVKLEDSMAKPFVERIMDYCLAKIRFEGKKLFIFNQALAYLETDDIIELIHFCEAEEICFLSLERQLPPHNDKLRGRCLVLDQDLCEILVRES